LLLFHSLHAQSGQRKKGKHMQLGVSALFYNRAQIDGINTTLSANYTDITTQIYTEYGFTDNLEALTCIIELASLNSITTNT
jgi:hypothetical protein